MESFIERNWTLLQSEESPKFSVFLWNCLSPSLVRWHRYLYKQIPANNLQWKNRSKSIKDRILVTKSDIICLQEIEEPFFNYLQYNLQKKGYVGFFVKRADIESSDGVAVFISKRFTVLKFQRIIYNEFDPSLSSNVAIVLAMRCMKTKKILIIANTHLIWNPKRGDIKLGQIDVLFKSISNLIENSYPRRTPILICGDFNLFPGYHIYNFIKDGTFKFTLGVRTSNIDPRLMSGQNSELKSTAKSDFTGPTSHPLVLKSAYESQQNRVYFSTAVGDSKEITDYIFYGTLKNEISSIECLRILDMGKKNQYEMIPNADNPSDHLHLIAEFQFIPNEISKI